MKPTRRLGASLIAMALLTAACSGGGASPSAAAPSTAPAATTAPSAAASPAGSGAASPAGSAAAGASPSVAADWCSQFHFTTVKPGVLTVATYGTGIPDVIINPDKTMTGLEGGMFDQFVKDCNLKMELFETTFASMILAVKEGKADIGTYIFWNADRSKQVFYTFPHWVADHTQVFTRADFPYTDASSLADKKVGTVTGFVWAGPIQQALGGKATLFPDAVTGGTALMNGQIDGWINGGTTIQNPPFDTKPGAIVGHDIKGGDFGIPEVLVTNKSYNITNCNNKDLAKAMSQNIANMVYTGAWGKILTDNKVSLNEGPTLEEPQQGC